MDYYETLARWEELQEIIPRLQGEERALREGLFTGAFPEPKEGTNTIVLPDGRKLKGVYKIYRNVREEELKALSLPKKVFTELFRIKHELRTTPYKGLDEDTKKIVDTALDIKPAGLPTLTIVAAKPKAEGVQP